MLFYQLLLYDLTSKFANFLIIYDSEIRTNNRLN